MENIVRFHLTQHVCRRHIEREIAVEEMKNAVRNHHSKTFLRPGEHGGKIYAFSRNCVDRKLTVIAELKKKECWIVTTYYE